MPSLVAAYFYYLVSETPLTCGCGVNGSGNVIFDEYYTDFDNEQTQVCVCLCAVCSCTWIVILMALHKKVQKLQIWCTIQNINTVNLMSPSKESSETRFDSRFELINALRPSHSQYVRNKMNVINLLSIVGT